MKRNAAILLVLCVVIFPGCKRRASAGSYDVSSFPGATADAQLSACLASIPAGGTCDARSYGASIQVIAATVSVGVYPAVTGFQRVVFSQATRFRPGGSDTQMFRLGPYADVAGLYADAGNQSNYSGVAVLIVGYLMLGDSTYVGAHLRDFILNGGTAQPQASSVGVELITPDASASTYFVTVSDGSIGGFHDDILLYAPPGSVGGVNANSFSHLRLGRAAYSIELHGASGFHAPALQLSGNTFIDVSAQAAPGLTLAHVYIRGAAAGNSFTGMQLFDSSAATILTASAGRSDQQTGVYSNHFEGWIYPIQDNAAAGNTASVNTWDCSNCTSNEMQRNTIKARSVKVGAP
jgi:hypothetical protein